jgi:hypothetical protein
MIFGCGATILYSHSKRDLNSEDMTHIVYQEGIKWPLYYTWKSARQLLKNSQIWTVLEVKQTIDNVAGITEQLEQFNTP